MNHPVRMKGYNISGLYLCFVMGNNFFWLKTYEIAKPQKMLLAMKKVEDGDWWWVKDVNVRGKKKFGAHW